MLKKAIFAALLLFPVLASAQTTTVTGTAVDANGNAYFPGTVSAYIVLAAGQPLPAGVPASGSIGPNATTSGGNFSVVLTSPLTWQFTICGTPTNIGPRANPTPIQVCFTTGPIAISGASQVITSSLVPLLLGPVNSVNTLPGAPVNSLQKNTGTGFGASQVIESGGALNVNEDFHGQGPNPNFDVVNRGGYYSPVTPTATTASTTSGLPTVTVASAIDFAVGHGIRIAKAGAATVLATPPAPTVTPYNVTGGATSYSYQVAAEGINGDLTAASAAGSTASGQATLGVTSLALASVARVSGVTTYVLQAPQNLQTNQIINVSGFTSTLFNGAFTIATVPDTTHFTVNQGGMNDNAETNAAATVSVAACNRLTLPSNSVSATIDTGGSGANVLRYWWWANKNAGAFSLVGVATGADPYFEDCGFNVTNAPDYVPATPPGASQAGYLATTITAIAGTTFTLAANAGQTVVAQNALHDNGPALIVTAKVLGATFNGGRILIPEGSLTAPAFVVNSTVDLRNANIGYNGGKAEVLIQGLLYLNQPIIPDAGMNFTGYASVGGFAFSYGPMASVTGNSFPLFFIRPPVQSIQFKNVKVAATSHQQISIFADNMANGGGATGLTFDQIGVGYSNNSWGSPWVLKGGVDIILRNGDTCSSHTLLTWNGSHGCLRFTNSSSALAPSNSQVPGRVQVDNLYCGVLCVQVDSIPSNTSGGAGNPTGSMGSFNFKGGIFENGFGPFMRMSMPASANTDYAFNDEQMADIVVGPGTPLVDATNSSLGNPVTFINSGTNGGPLLVVDSGNTAVRPVFVNSFQPFGNAVSSTVIGPQSGVAAGGPASSAGAVGSYLYMNNGMGVANGTNGKYGYALAAPTGSTASVIAGGSNPIGTTYIAWTAVDQNGYETALSAPVTVVFSSGNQQIGTASCTGPVPTVAVQGFNLYWSTGGGYGRHNVSPLAACTLSNITALANNGNYSGALPNATSSSLDSNGTTTHRVRLGAGPFHNDISAAAATANRTTSLADANVSFPAVNGSVPITGYQNSVYDNFNRANGAIGGNWNANTNGFNVASNVIVGSTAGANNLAAYSAITFSGSLAIGAGQFSQSTITALNGGTDFIGPSVFVQSSGDNRYTCMETTTTLFIQRSIAGATTTLTSGATTGAVGDVLRIEATVSGATTTLTCFKNGAQALTITNTTFTSGSPGIFQFGNVASQDNWSGGNFHPIGQLDIEQDWVNLQHFNQGVTVGVPTDPTLLRYGRYAAAQSPALVAANTCASQSFTFTGIRAADILIGVNKPTEQAGLSVMPGHVSAANTLTLNFCNNTGAGITPTAAETYNVVVVQ